MAETDRLIDEARAALAAAPLPLSAREQEEAAARAALEAESAARREARAELRTLWRKRRETSTAMLGAEEAAAVDLIRERDAEIEELRRAVAILEAGNERLGVDGAMKPKRSSKPVLSLRRATS